MSVSRVLQRSVRRDMGKAYKKVVVCPTCHAATRIKKDGTYHRHRMPPKVFGYNLPLRAGPICKLSGKPANDGDHAHERSAAE